MRERARSSSPASACDIVSRWRNRYNGQISDTELTASQIGKDTGQLIAVLQLLKTDQDNINNLTIETAQIGAADKQLGH